MLSPNSSGKTPLPNSHEISTVDESTPLLLDPQPLGPAIEQPNRDGVIEAQPLLPDETRHSEKSLLSVIAVLLVGVFVSQADTVLVLATYSKISSEFQALQDGSWLLSSSMLAQCVAQPLYGKLSDIFGRKRCLQAAYVLFAMGTIGAGLGQTLSQVIVGRAVQGLGGAGMVCMVSILLTDLVPLHDVAVYRSYVNIVQTAGRSSGGIIGGYLAETFGWRWAFLVEFPPTLLAIFLVKWKLHIQPKPDSETFSGVSQKLKRIDFPGALLMSLSIVGALFVLDLGGQKVPWGNPIIPGLAAGTCIYVTAFLVVEKYVATEPVFPVRLITHYVVITSYTALALQNMAATAMMLVVPMYFQVTKLVSTGGSGAYLVPSVIGNTIGGLVTGAWIQRTGRYKLPVVVGFCCSIMSMTGLVLLWPSGVGEEDIAIAGSGLYLSANVGSVAGISVGNAVYQFFLQRSLTKALKGYLGREKIISRILEDISYIQKISAEFRRITLPAFVSSFQEAFILSLGICVVGLVVGLALRERRLRLQ